MLIWCQVILTITIWSTNKFHTCSNLPIKVPILGPYQPHQNTSLATQEVNKIFQIKASADQNQYSSWQNNEVMVLSLTVQMQPIISPDKNVIENLFIIQTGCLFGAKSFCQLLICQPTRKMTAPKAYQTTLFWSDKSQIISVVW